VDFRVEVIDISPSVKLDRATEVLECGHTAGQAVVVG
jgi:hypothetical protein